MKTLSDYFGVDLKVIQPSFFKGVFEMRSGRELVAIMSHPKFFSRHALVEGDLTGSWEFYFPKFFSLNVAIRQLGYEIPIAEYHNRFISNKEFIYLPNRQKLILKSFLLKTKKIIQTEAEENLVEIIFKHSIKLKADIIINKKSELLDKYPWLILLVIYIENQRRQRKT